MLRSMFDILRLVCCEISRPNDSQRASIIALYHRFIHLLNPKYTIDSLTVWIIRLLFMRYISSNRIGKGVIKLKTICQLIVKLSLKCFFNDFSRLNVVHAVLNLE